VIVVVIVSESVDPSGSVNVRGVATPAVAVVPLPDTGE
jgi:hypothetical protein